MSRAALRLHVLPGEYAVCRFPPGTPVGAGGSNPAGLWSVTRTPEEVSVVCRASDAPAGATAVEPGWCVLRVQGPLPFELVGILASITTPLAAAGVPVFAISTHDTDYVLVKAARLADASAALRKAGLEVVLHSGN